MHFALVIPELHKQGGTERCMASLAEALERRGHRFTVFANRRDPSVLAAAPWHRVPMVRSPHIPRFFSFFVAQSLARRWANLKGERFDVVFSTGPDVLTPNVTVFHCSAAGFAELARQDSQEQRGSWLSRLKRWNSELSYRAIAKVERRVMARGARQGVAISRALKDEFTHFHGAQADRLRVIPDGVDLSDFYPRGSEVRARVRAELGIGDDQRVVLFVGHNWFRKGLSTLIEAVARIDDSNVLLLVAGAGEDTLRQEATRKLSSRVRFVGTHTKMPELYAAADVLALPTLHEPFGLPVLEAMACRLPVIVSRNSGVAELITDGTDGLLISNPQDAAELCTQLQRVLTDAHFAETLAVSGRRTAERFSWDSLATEFEALCIDAAGRNGR